REAADAPRRAAAAVAAAPESPPVRRRVANRPGRLAVAAAAGRMRADPPLRFRVHRAVGAARPEIRSLGAPRRRLPELALHRAAARAVFHRRAEAAGRGARLRCLPPPARAART